MNTDDEGIIGTVKDEVKEMMRKFELYPELK
jgi:hypothetical protein